MGWWKFYRPPKRICRVRIQEDDSILDVSPMVSTCHDGFAVQIDNEWRNHWGRIVNPYQGRLRIGVYSDGSFKTAVAKTYPPPLCEFMADGIMHNPKCKMIEAFDVWNVDNDACKELAAAESESAMMDRADLLKNNRVALRIDVESAKERRRIQSRRKQQTKKNIPA